MDQQLVVKKKVLFFAIKGHNKNGEKFIKEAIKKGALYQYVQKL